MLSNPITDAHEKRAQPEEGNADTNNEEFGSHVFPILWPCLVVAAHMHRPCRRYFAGTLTPTLGTIMRVRTVVQAKPCAFAWLVTAVFQGITGKHGRASFGVALGLLREGAPYHGSRAETARARSRSGQGVTRCWSRLPNYVER